MNSINTTNQAIFYELQQVEHLMSDFFRDNNLSERNKLVPRWRELHRSYDWGFVEHERVETVAWYGRWEEAVITMHDKENNMFYVKNDKRWEIGVSGYLIRKVPVITESSVEVSPEQHYLF